MYGSDLKRSIHIELESKFLLLYNISSNINSSSKRPYPNLFKIFSLYPIAIANGLEDKSTWLKSSIPTITDSA